MAAGVPAPSRDPAIGYPRSPSPAPAAPPCSANCDPTAHRADSSDNASWRSAADNRPSRLHEALPGRTGSGRHIS